MAIRLSLVIPVKDTNDPKLKELLRSIEAQDFQKGEMETLVITEGTSESAKAIGIRKSKGEVIGILASDNELIDKWFLTEAYRWAILKGSSYPCYYHYKRDDNILNRYFSLIGGNDTLSFYMRKNDRSNYINGKCNHKGTLGDNGYFVKKSIIENTDLDNYYHIDNAHETNVESFPFVGSDIWHKTGGNIFKFFAKRYRYGLKHAFNKNRRWHLVDFKQPKDIWRLTCFILFTITLVEPLMLSLRGYRKIKDVAWFIHPMACLFTLAIYTTLLIHLGLRKLFQSLSVPMAALRA